MANISKITLSGVTYDIKDAVARGLVTNGDGAPSESIRTNKPNCYLYMDLQNSNLYYWVDDGSSWMLMTKGNTSAKASGSTAGIVVSGGDVTITDGIITVKDDSHNHVISNIDGLQDALDARNNNITLDDSGKIPSSYLPSYVDDVVVISQSEFEGYESRHGEGLETGKIYIVDETNKTYRFTGNDTTVWAEVSASIALGETSSTAYRGDRGAVAYNHSQKTSGNPHGVTKSDVGLGNVPNVTTNDQTPTFTAATTLATLTSGEKLSVAFGKIAKAITDLISHIANKSNPHGVTKSQIGLGNVENKSGEQIRAELTTADVTAALGYTPSATDTKYTHPTYTAKASGLYKVTVDTTGHVSAATAVAKSDITALGIPAQDTTYSAANGTSAGLMSASHYTKLEGVASGATKNSFSVSEETLTIS